MGGDASRVGSAGRWVLAAGGCLSGAAPAGCLPATALPRATCSPEGSESGRGRQPRPGPARPLVRRRTLRARGCNKGKWLRGGEGCGAADGLPASTWLLPLSRGGTGAEPGAVLYVFTFSAGLVPRVLVPARRDPSGTAASCAPSPGSAAGAGWGNARLCRLTPAPYGGTRMPSTPCICWLLTGSAWPWRPSEPNSGLTRSAPG